MALTFSTLDAFFTHGYDAVIDARSPSEFAEDRVPGAISLPVLDDDERAQVGTIYKQQSPFLARKLGAALVFRNAAAHIEGPLSHHGGRWRPLVYCWRGGQRSGSFAWMLGQIGWRAETVEGGYRSWRRLVKSYLYDCELPHRLVLIDGYTGAAKTEVLRILASRGWQVLDLEKIAAHRGSLLGGLNTPQPSQKAFESQLASALCQMSPDKPVLVEAESSKIGARIIPPSIWAKMKTAPRLEISAPVDARVDYLARAYDDVLSDRARLEHLLWHLRAVRGHAVVDRWFELIAAGDKRGLTRALVNDHYDPAYAKSRRLIGAAAQTSVSAPRLDAEGLERVADGIERSLTRA